MSLTGEEWLAGLADGLGVPAPSPAELEDLLALAGLAAHASERTAAPLSCWMAGRAGIEPARARAVAEELAARLAGAG